VAGLIKGKTDAPLFQINAFYDRKAEQGFIRELIKEVKGAVVEGSFIVTPSQAEMIKHLEGFRSIKLVKALKEKNTLCYLCRDQDKCEYMKG
jgi:hypothetical protein